MTLSWVLGLACVAAPAAARTPTSAERAEAKSRFDRAIRLFEDGSYESALVEFRTSLGDYPTRVAAFNIAVCLRKLGRFDEEEDALAYVAEHFPTSKRAEAEELRRARQEAADRIANVVVVVNEAGAVVSIDGRLRGTSPVAPLRVSAGVRNVVVRKEGFHPYEARIDLPSRSSRTLDVKLEPVAAPAPVTVPAPAPAPPPPTRAPLWPVFVLGGAGVAAGAVGGLFLGLRAGTVADARGTCHAGLDATTFATCQDQESQARTQGLAGGVLVGTGIALLLGAGVYAVVRGVREPAVVSVYCAPSLRGVGCGGTF